MAGNRFQMEMGIRDRCTHKLRLRLPGKSNICLICQCNKIDDILLMDLNEKWRMPSDSTNEIIHHLRLIHSVLEAFATIEEKNMEILITQFLQTSLALLKMYNDEIEAVVAQALDKINSTKAPVCLLEEFLQNLSVQEKSNSSSFYDRLSLLRKRSITEKSLYSETRS